MNFELRQWYFGDEENLINIYDHYDRSQCYDNFKEPGTTSHSDANFRIRWYVDMGYEGEGFARAIVLDDKVVGHIQYTKRHDIYDANCDVEVYLLPEACGKSIGSEAVRQMEEYAFNDSNFECMFATMLDTNVAARRMFEKAGMKYCGIDDSCEWERDGKPCTKVVYGIRRPRKETKGCGVELRPWEARDIDALVHLYESGDSRYDDIPNPIIRCGRARSLEEIEAMKSEDRRMQMLFSMRETVDGWNVWERRNGDIYRAIVNNGEIVGLISVCMQYGNQSIDGLLGYMMMKEHCGKGVATKAVPLMLEEAFRLRPQLHRVTAWVYATNEASKRVLQKNGFHLEGSQKEAVLCEGKPTDHLVYGLLKQAFESNN